VTGATGGTGAAGSGGSATIEAYGAAYAFVTGATNTVVAGAAIPLNTQTALQGVATSGSGLQVLSSGQYLVSYHVTWAGGGGDGFGIAINGVVNQTTVMPIDTFNAGGTFTLNLPTNAVLTLVNISSTSTAIAVGPAAGAWLNVAKLGEVLD
jgi:hypothetical protein